MSIPGSNIRLLRRQMNLSLRTLAEATGIDESSLSRLETGKGGYSTEGINRIADALHVSLGVLFAEPEMVETAASRTREIPILNADQLAEWRGTESLEFGPRQEYMYAEVREMSRQVFGWVVRDDANRPFLKPEDKLIFEARRQPVMGDVVIAQDADHTVTIGRLRVLPPKDGEPNFDVVPHDMLYPTASKLKQEKLELRGVLVELRRKLKFR